MIGSWRKDNKEELYYKVCYINNRYNSGHFDKTPQIYNERYDGSLELLTNGRLYPDSFEVFQYSTEPTQYVDIKDDDLYITDIEFGLDIFETTTEIDPNTLPSVIKEYIVKCKLNESIEE